MDYEPISVALKFGFLAVLYLFLLWIARSALKDLRRTVVAGTRRDRLPPRARPSARRRAAATPGWSPSAAAASSRASAST